MQGLAKKLALTIGSAFSIAMAAAFPAEAETLNFSWNGNAGYSAKGSCK